MNVTRRHEALDGKIVQFEKYGVENTEDVFCIARLRADELGIETILVASISKMPRSVRLRFSEGKGGRGQPN